MRHFTPLAVLCAAAAPALAADPPIDTAFLKQYAETRGFMLGRPAKPKITPDGKTVLFLRSGPTTPTNKLFAFDIKTQETKELLSPEALLKGADENLTPEEKARRERQRVSVGGFADYHLDPDGTRVLVTLSGKPYIFDRTSGKVRELAVGKGTILDVKWSPDGKYVSYVRDFDVYAYDLAADKELPVTTGGTEAKTNGLAEFVAQEEMDRHTGYWWSPDSKSIAFAEADHAGVEVWYIADPLKPESPPQKQYYPRPGKKNVSVRLGIRKLAGGDTVWMTWPKNDGGAKFEYLARVVWQKYGPLTVVLQDRKQQEADAFAVDPADGSTKRLFSMRTWKRHDWIDLAQTDMHWMKDGPLVVLGGDFAIRNETVKVVLVASEDFTPSAIAAIDPVTREMVVQFRGDPTVLEAVHGVISLKADEPFGGGRIISRNRGWDGQIQSYTGTVKAGVITSTARNEMPRSTIDRAEIPSVAVAPPFKPNVVITEFGDFYTAIVRPQKFDPKKKYPVIVDVYGGPHHIHVQQAMRNWLVPQWLADQGFIVVAIDNRGTPGRGREWERAIYQNFGTVPIDDQAKGVAALCKKFPEMDADRVGIVGWSFGGYNAANAVLRRPDVFKAAVAGAPVTDWTDYDTHYTERYLGLLPESKPAYDDASLIPLAKNLTRPLLLVHGTADDNVYYRHSLKLADALFRAGKEFDTLPLPGVTHMYSADPVVMEKLWLRTVRFFRAHLGGPTGASRPPAGREPQSK